MAEPTVTTEEIIVPSVDPNVGVHRFALTNVRIAERRIPEIGTVNRASAPDLLAVMNVAFLNLVGYLSALRAEKVQAKKKLKEVESVIVLDKAPAILEAKGLPQSKDTREAVVHTDADYKTAEDHLNMVTACIDFLEGKKEAVTMAYNAVKKIIPESSPSLAGINRLLNGHIVERTS